MNTKEDVLIFLENKLKVADINLDENLKKHIKHSVKEMNALNGSVIDFINSNLNKNELPKDKPGWLDDIDRFFDEKKTTSNPRLNSFHLHHFFIDVIALMSPIVSIEHILSMESFSQKFISSLELSFMSRLNLPRNVAEAKKLYAFVLTLPASSKGIFFKNGSQYGAPYMSQMLFVALIMREAQPKNELWKFQLECLKTCPEHLLAYGSINKNGLSYRPSFWMAHFVSTPEFRHVLTERASAQYQVDLSKVLEFESSRAQVQQELSVSDNLTILPFRERVSASQRELAELLIKFEELLKEKHPDVYNSLKPGASNEKIDKLNEVLAPLRLPEDFITLYKWHDGIEYEGYLFGFPDFLSIEDALQQYREALDIGADFLWCKAWFTMGYESKVYLLVPMSETVQENSPVLYHDIEGGDIEIHHESVKQCIKAYIEAYSNGIIQLDDGSEYREMDDHAFETIRLKHSPNSFQYEKNEKACYSLCDSSGWPDEWKEYKVGK